MHNGHKYKLILTASEYDTIRFLSGRGYCMALYVALSHEDTLCEPVDPGDMYYIPEHLAWDIVTEFETNGGHGFGPVQSELNAKLYSLLREII
jgi:hypothetical protein